MSPRPADEDEIAYHAMAAVIDAELAGEFTASKADQIATAADLSRHQTVTDLMGMSGAEFSKYKRAQAEAEDTPGCPRLHQGRCLSCEPPTAAEVRQAKEHLAALRPRVRPMYRNDWERRTGGRGPTVAEHRTQLAYQHTTNRDQARRDYETLRQAHAASDKRQDRQPDRSDIACRNRSDRRGDRPRHSSGRERAHRAGPPRSG